MGKLKITLLAAAAVLALGAGAMATAAADYHAGIDADIVAVLRTAAAFDPAPVSAAELAALPAPVRRYMAFAFQGEPPRRLRAAGVMQHGAFRRPGSTTWEPMTAEQYVAAAGPEPAFVFTGSTQVLPGVPARAMDAYVDGRMRMRAKLFSAIPVMAEDGGALDHVSILRFFIESALYPSALLPGPNLRWEAIDADHARAVVLADGAPIGAYRATVDAAGALVRMESEADGDPATAGRYHGAGEVVTRGDYRAVDGVMVPYAFTLSRRIAGQEQPFWRGTVTRIAFDVAKRF